MTDLKVKDNDINLAGSDSSDIKIEHRYWRICLGFLCVSPVLLYWLWREPLVLNLKDIRYFPLVAVLSVPATIMLEFILSWAADPSHPPKLFIRNPSVRIATDIGQDLDSWLAVFTERLSELDFQIERGREELAVGFSKPKAAGGVHSFSDHAFSGEMTAEKTNFGWQAHLELTFEDIVLLDSGERRKMKALSEYLVGNSDEPFSREIHLVMLNGLVTGLAVHVVLYLGMLDLVDVTSLVFPCAAAAISMVLAALLIMSFNRSKYIGYRLAGIATVLAGMPYAPDLIRWLNVFFG